jgi:hypothetical protein
MFTGTILRKIWLIPIAPVIFMAVMCGAPDKKIGDLKLTTVIEGKTGDWVVDGQAEIYDRESIFKYMNGAGEIYRMYDYRQLEVVRLKKAGASEITIELFDMDSAGDGFGVFSHMRESPDAGVGEGSEYRKGLLCFWQGKYFVCIRSEDETPEIKQTIFEFAEIITDAITPAKATPDIMKLIPEDNLSAETVRYFHLFSTLNYHYYLAAENIFNLDEQTEAFLATYKPHRCYFLGIKYPAESTADAAYRKFVSSYIPEAGESGAMVLENNKWVVSERYNEYIFVVFDAPDSDYGKGQILFAKRKLLN